MHAHARLAARRGGLVNHDVTRRRRAHADHDDRLARSCSSAPDKPRRVSAPGALRSHAFCTMSGTRLRSGERRPPCDSECRNESQDAGSESVQADAPRAGVGLCQSRSGAMAFAYADTRPVLSVSFMLSVRFDDFAQRFDGGVPRRASCARRRRCWRTGAGFANGRNTTPRALPYAPRLASSGSSVTPAPVATIWRKRLEARRAKVLLFLHADAAAHFERLVSAGSGRPPAAATCSSFRSSTLRCVFFVSR